MSQTRAKPDSQARSEEEEDVAYPRARRPEFKQGQPASSSAGDGDRSPEEPDEGELELIGDDDLGAADLGPIAPVAPDPDADSGRVRKMRATQEDSGAGLTS